MMRITSNAHHFLQATTEANIVWRLRKREYSF